MFYWFFSPSLSGFLPLFLCVLEVLAPKSIQTCHSIVCGLCQTRQRKVADVNKMVNQINVIAFQCRAEKSHVLSCWLGCPHKTDTETNPFEFKLAMSLAARFEATVRLGVHVVPHLRHGVLEVAHTSWYDDTNVSFEVVGARLRRVALNT